MKHQHRPATSLVPPTSGVDVRRSRREYRRVVPHLLSAAADDETTAAGHAYLQGQLRAAAAKATRAGRPEVECRLLTDGSHAAASLQAERQAAAAQCRRDAAAVRAPRVAQLTPPDEAKSYRRTMVAYARRAAARAADMLAMHAAVQRSPLLVAAELLHVRGVAQVIIEDGGAAVE